MQNQEAHHVMTDAAVAHASEAEGQYQPLLSGDCEAVLPVSSVTGHSPVLAAEASKSAVSAILSRTPHTAQPHAQAHHNMQEGSTLSPRASLDLSLHPDNDQMCVVRITADPEREHHPHSSTHDRLIEDPTAVAVLEHAFQPNTTHPVFHVHMPSRRSSLQGHETASDSGSDADHSLQPGSSRVHAHHALSQPLLQTQQEEQAVGLWPKWRKLLANPEAVPFFAMSLLMGFGTGILSVYLFLYLDELGELNSCSCDRLVRTPAVSCDVLTCPLCNQWRFYCCTHSVDAFPSYHVTCHHNVKHLVQPCLIMVRQDNVSICCCIFELLQALHGRFYTGVHDLCCKTDAGLHKQLSAANWPSMCSIESVMQVGVRC